MFSIIHTQGKKFLTIQAQKFQIQSTVTIDCLVLLTDAWLSVVYTNKKNYSKVIPESTCKNNLRDVNSA